MIDSKPFEIFSDWYNKAKEAEDSYPDGFTLATASSNGVPSARTVLLKRILPEGFVFFTNYSSQKAKELLENPHAHMLFYWKSTEKQIRVNGTVEKASSDVSDSYWATRPLDSQINSALSDQSSPLDEDFNYEKEAMNLKKAYPDGLPRPDDWGGFVIKPNYFEFWEEGPYRWHKRHTFKLSDEEIWVEQRLYP